MSDEGPAAGAALEPVEVVDGELVEEAPPSPERLYEVSSGGIGYRRRCLACGHTQLGLRGQGLSHALHHCNGVAMVGWPALSSAECER